GVSDRGRPKLDFSKFHIIRFALIRQNTANATRIMKRMAGYISRILTQAIATSLATHTLTLAVEPPYANLTPTPTIPHGQQHQCGRLSPTPTSTNARRPQQPLDHWSRFNANATPLASCELLVGCPSGSDRRAAEQREGPKPHHLGRELVKLAKMISPVAR